LFSVLQPGDQLEAAVSPQTGVDLHEYQPVGKELIAARGVSYSSNLIKNLFRHLFKR
jgi:hypothetical protein